MLQIRCKRLQPLACVSASRRPQRKRVNLAAAVVDVEPEPLDIPEIKDMMDASLGNVDSAIYRALKDNGPKMMPFTRTFITIGIVCTLIVVVSQALAYAARWAAKKLTQREKHDDEVTTYSTTASLLQPLVVTLPIIGGLVALQRGFTGLTTLFHVCTKQPAWFKNPVADLLHWFVHWAAPLQCHLANATGVVVLLSLTWTLLILKRRVFNRIVAKLTIDAHGTKEESAAADLSRSLLPLNTLMSWFLIGASILLGLKLIGLDPAPLLAVGGVSGIVVGFASQSLLLNLIAGISIFITRPFVVGDVVQMKNNHLLIGQGTITNISPLRTTYLDDNSESVTLPNKLITDLIITNFGRESERCAVQRENTKSRGSQQPKVKQILTHVITLQRPDNECVPYDNYARMVAGGLRTRLSTLPNTVQNSMKVFVSGLSASGEIQITIVGVGLRTPHMPAETIREEFYLAIQNALCTLKREHDTDVQHDLEEKDAEAKKLAEAEIERACMSGNNSGPGMAA